MAQYNKTTHAKAVALVQGIQNELKKGTKHYNQAGEELTTVKAILETLVKEGRVSFSNPPIPYDEDPDQWDAET